VLGGSDTPAVQLASPGLAFSSWTALTLGHAANVASLVVGAGVGATVADAGPPPLDDPGPGAGFSGSAHAVRRRTNNSVAINGRLVRRTGDGTHGSWQKSPRAGLKRTGHAVVRCGAAAGSDYESERTAIASIDTSRPRGRVTLAGAERAVDRVEDREVVDVRIEDRRLHDVSQGAAGLVEDGGEVAQRLFGLSLDAVSDLTGDRVDPGGP
jgi:hypothetical protein